MPATDRRWRALATVALLIGIPASTAAAQDPAPPPPDFADRKQPLPDWILKRKSEDRYVTGIPMIGLDPELGFVLGAALQFFDNGPRTSPLFAYSPYRRQIQVAALSSVEGNFGSVYLAYDQPYVDDTPWRIKGYVGYRKNKFENYFGTGEQTLEPLHYPGSPKRFHHLDDFKNAIDDNVGGISWSEYVSYQQRYFLGAASLEYDLVGGLLRPLVGLQIRHVGVTDFTGRIIDGAVEQETKLAEDHRLGRIRGFDGGWDNCFRVGIAFDTRDYEPDPTSGVLAQAILSQYLEALGSESTYAQATFGVTAYLPPLPGYHRLVLVGNVVYSVRLGDVPFYAMSRLALPRAEVRSGLGGFSTLRGYSTNRFVGPTTVGANAEVRWSFTDFELWDQQLKLALAPFVDVGRVFDHTNDFSFDDWKYSWGIGLRLAWNLATVVSFDFGVGPEGSLFYMELGHAF